MLLALAFLVGAEPPALVQSQGGGVITNPVGLFLRHDLAVDTGLLPSLLGAGPWGDIRVGAFTQYLVVSTEFGARLSWLTHPELLILSLEAASDRGLFREKGDLVRTSHGRTRLTAQALVNVKLERWWLYSRSTASVRLRDFVEQDDLQNVVVKDELTLEQATALFTRLTPLKSLGRAPAQLWWYGEYTLGTLVDLNAGPVDARPHRLSTGLLSEHFPARNIVLNLDVFWSFANNPHPGPGVVVLYGFSF